MDAPADRTRIEVPKVLLAGIVERLDPLRVIVFGSHARGDAGPDSDWDILAILDDDAPRDRLTLQAGFEASRAYGRAADVVPIRAGRFAAKRTVVNSLSWIADREGVVVYERA